jgi:nucleotide sugar dehydrogenase
MIACVVGLGRIGLPVAVSYASNGLTVIGVDIDRQLIEKVARGDSPYPHEEGLNELLSVALSRELISFTTDLEAAVRRSDVIVVVVAVAVTPDGSVEYDTIDALTSRIGASVQRHQLVIYESTLPPGTVRYRIAPMLASIAGRDMPHLAYSPERVYSGRVLADLRRYRKIVAGLDEAGATKARDFYHAALGRPGQAEDVVLLVRDTETAELTKLFETTYRDVNIALANEFAMAAHQYGVDIDEAISAANTQPFSQIHRPGLGTGGHCIPVNPRMLLAGVPTLQIPVVARLVNDSMIDYALRQVEMCVGPFANLKVAVLGLSYRGGVRDTAGSRFFPLVERLRASGAQVYAHDPFFTAAEIAGLHVSPFELGEHCDVAVVQADHQEYAALLPEHLPGVRALYDGRGVVSPSAWDRAILIGMPRSRR